MIVAAFLLLVSFCHGAHSTLSEYLDMDENFHITWDFTDTDITFTATVNTTGWFGIGFSSSGGMRDADIIVAGVENGKPYLQDMHSPDFTRPLLDKKQDVVLISGYERDGKTSVTFQRKLDTCDKDDLPITTDTMRVLYAISPDNTDLLKYHTADKRFRGNKSLYLRRRLGLKNPNIPADAVTFDLRVKNITIPSDRDTRYYCELMRVPKVLGKHHLIKVDPLIQQENIGMVHHLILYGCYDKINREHYFQENKKTGYDCYNSNIPNDINICRSPVTLWAIGGGSNNYPEETGLPIGGGHGPTYLMMEVHYDNPQLKAGYVDNSGVRLTLTKSLRKYDAGILPTGSIYGINVPPSVEDYTHTGFCTSSCTKKLLNQTITVFAALQHGHLAARKIFTRHFRNGKELDIIIADRSYDFNYQQFLMLDSYKQIIPGDDIMTTCHYNTKGRTMMTWGDMPSTAEMCISYLFYYPAQNIGDCFSSPVWTLGVDYMYDKLHFPKKTGRTSHFEIMNEATAKGLWTESKVQTMLTDMVTMPHMDNCRERSSQFINPFFNVTYNPPAGSQKPPPETPSSHCQKAGNVIG